MAYKYLLFDHDGVLVDTEQWYYEATRRALAELDISLDEQTYQDIMIRGVAAWELAEKAGVEPELLAAQQRKRNAWYQAYLRSENLDIPGVVETLTALSARHSMAIVTTCKTHDFDVIQQDREIVPLMEFVLKREDYGLSKPHPEPYLLALERFGAQPHEALVIEDSERGLRAAVAAGIDCCIVHNAFTARHDFSRAQYHVQTLAELHDILAG